MARKELHPLAVTTQKWDLDSRKMLLVCPVVFDEQEISIEVELTFGNPEQMVEVFLDFLSKAVGKSINAPVDELTFNNAPFLQKRLYQHFNRFIGEINNNRRKKPVSTTHLELFPENQEMGFLPTIIQFFVVYNRARRLYEKEEWKKTIEPLRHAISLRPDFGFPYKLLARSLKKLRQYEEAMAMYEQYATIDDSLDAWQDLAKSFRKGKQFEKSEKIYHDILKRYPGDNESRIGLAQIYFSTQQPSERYLTIFDELHKEDPIWLRDWLVNEFNFRMYVQSKTALTPGQATEFLGLSHISELTKKAFKNEVPSHFNPAKARLSFFKEELEGWATVMTRFNCLQAPVAVKNIVLEEDGTSNEEKVGQEEETNVPGKGKKTRVEEILAAMRARKAEQQESQAPSNGEEEIEAGMPETPARKRANRRIAEKSERNRVK